MIFDLGKVILEVDFDKTIEAFNQLAGFDTAKFYNYHNQINLFDHFETGKITATTFRNGIRALLKINASDDEIDYAWNVMLGATDLKTLKLLSKLKKKYKTFLLSNTNIIHIEAAHNYLQKAFAIKNFDPFFHKVYYSHEIGLKKPDLMAFQIILDEHNLQATDSLFIDDKQENIIAAQKLGLQTLLMPPNEKLIDLMEAYL